MKPRRYDQLWSRWLLIDSGVTFEEWLDSLRERRKHIDEGTLQMEHLRSRLASSPLGLMNYHQQQAMHGMMGLGGIYSGGL